jgi:hypothetical protein
MREGALSLTKPERSYKMTVLTEKEIVALNALRENVESDWVAPNGKKYGEVYLDNAIPIGWSGKTWSGVLGSLAAKGFYVGGEDGCFGDVLLGE